MPRHRRRRLARLRKRRRELARIMRDFTRFLAKQPSIYESLLTEPLFPNLIFQQGKRLVVVRDPKDFG